VLVGVGVGVLVGVAVGVLVGLVVGVGVEVDVLVGVGVGVGQICNSFICPETYPLTGGENSIVTLTDITVGVPSVSLMKIKLPPFGQPKRYVSE